MADVLKEESIPFPPASIPHLNLAITSYATLNDSHEFLIAYYLLADTESGGLRRPLFVTHYGKITGRWQHAALDSSRIEGILQNPDWAGSVLKAGHKDKFYYLDLHWGPDAGCLLILAEDLRVEDALPGWPQGWFKSDTALYTKNLIHFADVHPETLWTYELHTHRSTQIYPQPNDPFREAFTSRLTKVINRDECRIRNWGCNPRRFTTDIASVEVNDETNSVAVQVKFEPEGFVDREVAENSGEWQNDEYVYIYHLQPFRWREFTLKEVKAKFGTDTLKKLLGAQDIERVFDSPAPN